MTKILEELAALEHDQWAHWARYMIGNMTEFNRSRWEKQVETSYGDLSNKEKESDREWARKVLEIINKYYVRK